MYNFGIFYFINAIVFITVQQSVWQLSGHNGLVWIPRIQNTTIPTKGHSESDTNRAQTHQNTMDQRIVDQMQTYGRLRPHLIQTIHYVLEDHGFARRWPVIQRELQETAPRKAHALVTTLALLVLLIRMVVEVFSCCQVKIAWCND